MLCDAEIGVFIFSGHGKLYELATRGSLSLSSLALSLSIHINKYMCMGSLIFFLHKRKTCVGLCMHVTLNEIINIFPHKGRRE